MISVRPADRTRLLAALCFGLSTLASSAMAQSVARPARVLLLFQQQAETQPMVEFTQRLRTTLRDELPSPLEFYVEALDLDRFAGREHSAPLVHYFADKYRAFSIDVVVPVGVRALQFTLDQLSEVFPSVPVVFALGAVPQIDPARLPANVTGRLGDASRFAPTLSMARALQPDAERIVVVSGAGAADSMTASAVLAAIGPLRDSLPVSVLEGLPLNVMLGRLRELSQRSIVIFANFRKDPAGDAFEPLDIVGSMARASAAPMYTQLRSYVGEGVVGGAVISFDDEGARTARLIGRVLRRRPAERMPPVETIPSNYVVDSRQLERWRLSDERLPPGAQRLFREPTIWERYRTALLLTVALIAAESLLIGLLLLERRRRKVAERSAVEARRQMAHMGRVALVSELAATLSHELRQPLAAIRANAEAGLLLLARSTADPEASEIFRNIIDDDVRAVDVIEDVRRLLRKDSQLWTEVDLNEICANAVRLLRQDATTRKVRLDLLLAPIPPVVIGDPVQLQQIVLNLAMNGLDAVAMSKTERFVVVRTESARDHADVVVQDSGPGISPVVQSHLFESFFSTKAGGLGLGLTIVRSIVDRHNGSVCAENHLLGGAVFRVRLPTHWGIGGRVVHRTRENHHTDGAERAGDVERQMR